MPRNCRVLGEVDLGLGLSAQGVEGVGFKVHGSGFKVRGLGFRAYGWGEGLGLKV